MYPPRSDHRHRILALLAVVCLFVPSELVQAQAPGQRWAVLIGVNEYLDPKIPDLKYCVADARRVFETLTKHGGFDPQRVLLIVDDQPRAHLRPLRMNLHRQIGDWLANCRPEDTVVVTFSGHGFVDSDTGEGFLAPADCEKDNLRATGFPTERLRQMLRDCAARQKLLILDCCHAGAVRSGEPTGATSEELSQVFTKAQGLITLASSRKDEVSYEWSAKQQGLFTYYLVEGLAGAADYDGDGVVNVDELYRYTFEKVPLAAQQELNARQRPVRVIGPDTEGVFALSRVTVVPRPLDTSLVAVFTVREEDASGRLVEGATVELFHRDPQAARPSLLATGRTDSAGRAQLAVKLSLSQQAQGTFAASVRRGESSRSYTLDKFPQSRSYALYVPRVTPPSSKPPATPPPTVPSSPPAQAGRTMENSIGIKLAFIPAGEFQMGSPESGSDAYSDEKPQHTVRITKPFYLGVTEVTQEQYERVMGSNPSGFKGAQLPVENVSWEDAMEFCRKLSELSAERSAGRVYRLPTEAEWEYACRAGSTTKWSFGDAESSLGDYAWFPGNAGSKTHPVGQKKPNAWGLYDMHGNVWEWCSDWSRREYTTTAVDDPTGPAIGSLRVIRGGGWYGDARGCRSAYRHRFTPALRLDFLGFRLAFSSVDQSGR
jgi:formylglycine-generating enzyme required for sulfatase activity